MKRRPRAARPQVHLQTAGRLVALRVRLTVLLLVLNVAGLAGMGAVALVVDSEQRSEVATAELRRVAGTAVALLSYDSGALRLDSLFTDPTAQGPTAVYVFEASRTDVNLVFAHPSGRLNMPTHALLDPARDVWRSGNQLSATATDASGHGVQLLAVPFAHGVTGAVAGTVVAIADPRPGQLAHQRLAVALVAGGAIFMTLAGAGGYLLARRGTRPAAEAVGQQEHFLADAAHELRTPLTVMRALSEAALKNPDQQSDALRQVLRSTERLTDSVEALLTRARVVAGLRALERQPFRLDQLAEEAVAEAVPAPHTVTVEVRPTVLYGDPALVRIAIQNLARNAVRHGRVGSEPARIRLVVTEATVTVEDSGTGVPDWALDARTRRFRTGATDGIGLGLAIAQWVAELHGGSLRLRSRPGGGTSAVLSLPDRPPARPSRRWGR
ncbi:HAMP domain-containing sensor histidine kinase [Longispora sp. K20-0274]|uniref:sensor histidine kinase n=1 Tax=Longispora sp. K20-0274 TaxID=3088255 RepID=UPI00399B6E37